MEDDVDPARVIEDLKRYIRPEQHVANVSQKRERFCRVWAYDGDARKRYKKVSEAGACAFRLLKALLSRRCFYQ